MNCSYVHTDKTNGKKTPCPHAVAGRSNTCIFHSQDVGPKDTAFRAALAEMLSKAQDATTPTDLDFKGFVFPSIDFKKYVFRGTVDFRSAVFSQGVDFREAVFRKQADFLLAEFRADAGFFAVWFESNVRLIGAKFRGRAIFNGCKFHGSTVFHQCRFAQFASWQAAKFSQRVIFQLNTFEQDADFRQSVFYRGVDFFQTRFNRRVDFEGARFHDEVVLSEAHIEFLKKLGCLRANMDGAVLHTAQIWENERLSRYTFRGAFLISVNLAGKELYDCDFTGAVFKAVLTVGWRPDRLTLANTKFIYTDYRSESTQSQDGPLLRSYTPVHESRVPAEGNFGEGEHADFTFADYLREPLRLNIALSVPPLLRTAVTNYLQLFTDFLKVTQGIPVELRTRLEGSKLRVEFLAQTEEDLSVIRESFAEYQNNAGHSFEELKLKIVFNKETTPLERELFLMKMETQLNHLRTELTYTKALLSKSEENRELLARLVTVSRSTAALFEPLKLAPQARPYESELSILRADLAGYSAAVKDQIEFRVALQRFLGEIQSEIQSQAPCERCKADGDGFWIFSSDSLWLFETALHLGSRLDQFKLRHPSSLGAFRCTLNRGRLNCIVVDAMKDFDGDAVIQSARIDQPMKAYLTEQKISGNQVWCTLVLKEDLVRRSGHLRFDPLPPLALDKGYANGVQLFHVYVT